MKIFATHAQRTNRSSFGTKITAFAALGLCLLAVGAAGASAQERDPFRQPIVRVPIRRKPVAAPATTAAPIKKAAPSAVAAPPIQNRIDNYKLIRQRCAELGVQCPKPTSVLTIDEMNVTGVFRTPRGYAAMVQATPIKLSYTIYPGEKFFDGQLVAIEETKLVFRRVTQMSDGKEIVSADNKALRQAGINGMAAARAENAAPMNPVVSVPAATATTGLSAEAVPMNEQAVKSAATPAPPVKMNQLPANGNQTDSEIKLNFDEKTEAKPADSAPAKKSNTKRSKKGASKK